MGQNNLMVDLKGFLQSEFVTGISKQLNAYEKKVKVLVKDLNLKSQEARDKSRLQLDNFAEQIKKTTNEVEKKVVTVVNQEVHRLNKGFNELVTYLKSVALQEKAAVVKAVSAKKLAKKPAVATRPSKGKKTSGSKKNRVRATGAKSRGNNASTDNANQLSH